VLGIWNFRIIRVREAYKMQAINFIIGGLGGQGILFMTKILAKTALQKGYDVMGAETHGMAQRGGSVISHLRMGEVNSSLVKTGAAQFLLTLEENEAYRNLPFLSRDGVLCSSRSDRDFPDPKVKGYLKENRIACHAIRAGKLALDMGAPMSTNLALIGFFSTLDQCPFSGSELRQTVETVSPEPFREVNLKVFDAGAGQAQNPV